MLYDSNIVLDKKVVADLKQTETLPINIQSKFDSLILKFIEVQKNNGN